MILGREGLRLNGKVHDLVSGSVPGSSVPPDRAGEDPCQKSWRALGVSVDQRWKTSDPQEFLDSSSG